MSQGAVAGYLIVLVLGIGVGLAAGVLLLRRRNRFARADQAEERAEALDVEARFEQLIQSITVGIVSVDRRGYVTALNAAAAAIFQITSQRVLGRAIIELIPSYDLDRRVRDALAGHPSRGTVLLSSPAARTLTVATLPIDGDDGAFIIATDETRVHELEQTRRDFVSNVSHELRTPLASINLMVETLLDREDDAEARAIFLPRVKEELDRLVQLVQDLLELARAESGRMWLRRGDVDLHAVTASALRTFEQRAQRLDLDLRLEGEETPIAGDEHRLAQVVVNLVDNALRHTPPGGSVVVTVAPRDGAAVLEVHDTGEGIPYRDLPHVFERFYLVDRSRARDAGGTGLGLSIVKQIVQAHGGSVTADSELGAGATFTCTLPLYRPAALSSG